MPIEEKDLRPCDCCGGYLTGADGRNPTFQIIRTSIAVVNAAGLRRKQGLAQMLGGGAGAWGIAGVMGLHESAAMILAEEKFEGKCAGWTEIYLCMDCYTEKFGGLAELACQVNEAREEKATDEG